MSGRQARAEALFERWGAPTILLSRTLISHLSSIVSLLAGLHRYRIHAFLAIALLGRLIWTAAYVGLGYTLAGNVGAATDFLKNSDGSPRVGVAAGRFDSHSLQPALRKAPARLTPQIRPSRDRVHNNVPRAGRR